LSTYTSDQLDALREVANIGSGTAASSLATMLGRSVDLSVPNVLAVPLDEAVEALGAPDTPVTAVVIPIFGAMDAVVVLLFAPEAADTLCAMLGVEPGTDVGVSALQEIGNILGTSYVGSMEAMTGLHLEPRPPQACVDMLGAVLTSVLMHVAGAAEVALVMDSALEVEGEACSLSFLLVPSDEGVAELLTRLGLG
jgi:chemotaxis protein CheC